MTYDLIIIGGGPAGASAAVYAARKRLNTLLILKEWGGQSIVSPEIFNWIGTPSVSGNDLAKMFKTHVEGYKGDYLTIQENEYVSDLSRSDDGSFSVKTQKASYSGKTVLIASGSGRRKLEIPSAEQFENKGVVYCASCDGPLFSGQNVAVIGGGNAGFESAAQLLAYCSSVTLLSHGPMFKADEITQEKVLAHPNMKSIKNAEILEITGEQFVTGLSYKDTVSGETHAIPVSGVFVEIGMLPNTDFAKNVVALDAYNRVIIDHTTNATNVPGIWAAGDCSNVKYHQNNIAAGDAVRALEDIYMFLRAK